MHTLSDFANAAVTPSSRPDVYEMLLWFLTHDRDRLPALAGLLIDLGDEAPNLIDDIFPHLDEAAVAALVEHSVWVLRTRGLDDKVDAVLTLGAHQVPEALTPHLRLLGTVDRLYPIAPAWRAADGAEIGSLVAHLDAHVTDESDLPGLDGHWTRLLRTGNTPAIARVLASAPIDARTRLVRWAEADDVRIDGDAIEPMFVGAAHHLFFETGRQAEPDGYVEAIRLHPTAHLARADDVTGAFGGVLATTCARCATPLSALLRLAAVPAGLGISSGPITLCACLRCLADGEEPLFYSHRIYGDPVSIDGDAIGATGTGAASPPPRGTVRVTATPGRWAVQNIGLSNGRENLNRLGGAPAWVQYADYPGCPRCGTAMRHIAQFDEAHPTIVDGSDGYLWDSVVYLFWCEPCRVSAAATQNT